MYIIYVCYVYENKKEKTFPLSPSRTLFMFIFSIRNIVEKTPSDGDLKLGGFTFTDVQCVITCP